mmetsp:Transcript_42969/g.71413  ORF Transcript_42969/g.71413 Transcript_42969/m.71413 type:complete len:192 (-) Transcript_42969:340-915(-)|eukprot:CAMPEP_0119314112 /NCGR_PEP_ID=MMETSP1333-20130426/31728_1 /TAXON_ID=418940 /ORGANISM="Scyphosphaera apsteinii, Strain RCC1455" /LENGTH=191 /DNA_ID=CAMNT_0007319165 /DNA_START=45 /DNA_END=620 /DNA_ORIENTATION=-
MLVESPTSTPISPSVMSQVGTAEDEATRQTLELAWKLQMEEEEKAFAQLSAVTPDGGDEDAESLALAIRLQQEEDDAALRAALGVNSDFAERGSPSNYAYEDLLRLNETVGTVSRGASSEAIDALRLLTVEQAKADDRLCIGEQCSICRMEFEADDDIRALPCGHAEHATCLETWLGVNKCCPLCQKEVAA